MLEGRKKRKKQQAKAIRPKELKKEIWLKQGQSKWLAFIVTCYEECERKKRRKR